MSTMDITPDTAGLVRWARTVRRQSEPGSKSADAARSILAECGVNPDPESFTVRQLDGLACASCGSEFGPGSVSAPVGYSDGGSQLFACADGWGCAAV